MPVVGLADRVRYCDDRHYRAIFSKLRRFNADRLHFQRKCGRKSTLERRRASGFGRLVSWSGWAGLGAAQDADFANLLDLVPHMPALENSLAARVDQAIQTNPYVNGRTLRFETDGAKVVLQGAVKSYFQKQMAQEVVRKVEGVEQIDNCLEVLWV